MVSVAVFPSGRLSCSGDGGGSVEGGGQAEAVSEGGRLENQQQLAQDFAHDNNEYAQPGHDCFPLSWDGRVAFVSV